MEKETWKDVKDYEGLYQVSNHGRVRSLDRFIKDSRYGQRFMKGCIKKLTLTNRGYLHAKLTKGERKKVRLIHQLVAEVFLNHKVNGHNKVINHKDFDRANNKLNNLEIISQRENANQKHLPSSSRYIGVYWYKKSMKWRSQLFAKGKYLSIGYYHNEHIAGIAYQVALINHLNK